MRQRSTRRRGTLVKRSLQIIASLALASVGWFLLGEPEELNAAETSKVAQALTTTKSASPPKNVIARVDGIAVTEEEIMTAAAHELVALEEQRRLLISETTRRVVHERLIAAEAERRGTTAEELIASEDYETLTARLEHEYGVEYLADSGA